MRIIVTNTPVVLFLAIAAFDRAHQWPDRFEQMYFVDQGFLFMFQNKNLSVMLSKWDQFVGRHRLLHILGFFRSFPRDIIISLDSHFKKLSNKIKTHQIPSTNGQSHPWPYTHPLIAWRCMTRWSGARLGLQLACDTAIFRFTAGESELWK